MKRTDAEFKAEVFRRYEQYRQERRRCIRRVIACCVPLVLIGVAAVGLPRLFPPVSEEDRRDEYTAMNEVGDMESVCLQISVVDGDGNAYALSRETADRLWEILGEQASDITTENKCLVNDDAGNISVSWSHSPLYEITFTDESGVFRRCVVFEQHVYIYDDGSVGGVSGWMEIDAEQADALRALLKKLG